MGRRFEALWDKLGGFPGHWQSVFGLNGSRGSEAQRAQGQKPIALAGPMLIYINGTSHQRPGWIWDSTSDDADVPVPLAMPLAVPVALEAVL